MAGRDSSDAATNFVDRLGVGAFSHAFDDDGTIWSRYGVTTQPAFVFLNDDGTFQTNLGGLGIDGLTSAANQLLET